MIARPCRENRTITSRCLFNVAAGVNEVLCMLLYRRQHTFCTAKLAYRLHRRNVGVGLQVFEELGYRNARNAHLIDCNDAVIDGTPAKGEPTFNL